MSDWVIVSLVVIGAFVLVCVLSLALDHRRKMTEIKHGQRPLLEQVFGLKEKDEEGER